MPNHIILLSGQISSGKSTLSKGLAEKYNIKVFKTSDVLKEKLSGNMNINRTTLQEEGDELDRKTNGKWVLDEMNIWERKNEIQKGAIVDSVRIREQVDYIKEHFWPRVIHIHLTAPDYELKSRYDNRKTSNSLDTESSYHKVKQNQTESQAEDLAKIADLVIDTKRSSEEDVLIRATSYIDTEIGSGRGYVDVLVGGQYGSEGKGQVAAYLAKEYDILIRVGGPNAGHSVYEGNKKVAYHQLPSGSNLGKDTKLLIGPGAVVNPEVLLKELSDHVIDKKRLTIDGRAMIITNQDKEKEATLVKTIGSTGQGVGNATARRILERGNKISLAKDIPDLKEFIGEASSYLEKAYKEGKRILLEGTQGTGLSLYHGSYPHVTSRDTTASACLSEAGIHPRKVRRVIMVCRTYPIRVESPKDGNSGPLNEISWDEVSKRSGKPLDEIIKTEKTTTTGKKRRVGEFEWYNVHKAALLNGATDIALTFTDYISNDNQNAMRFEQLTEETLNFIQEVERVTNVPVSLISTGFNGHSIIDKRLW